MPRWKLRRSKRLVLSVRSQVLGPDVFQERFSEFTSMICVNAHGGSLALAAQVEAGQKILVVNRSTSKEQESRVVQVGQWESSPRN